MSLYDNSKPSEPFKLSESSKKLILKISKIIIILGVFITVIAIFGPQIYHSYQRYSIAKEINSLSIDKLASVSIENIEALEIKLGRQSGQGLWRDPNWRKKLTHYQTENTNWEYCFLGSKLGFLKNIKSSIINNTPIDRNEFSIKYEIDTFDYAAKMGVSEAQIFGPIAKQYLDSSNPAPMKSSSPASGVISAKIGAIDQDPLISHVQVKSVTDYYLDAPVQLLGMIDDTAGKFVAHEARAGLIKLQDDHNGYLQVEGNVLINKYALALFIMKDGSRLLGIQSFGGSVTQVRFLRRTEAGEWSDATEEVWPKISQEFLISRFRKAFPNYADSIEKKLSNHGQTTVSYELPRSGTTIIAKSGLDEPEFFGKELFKIRFTRERFEIIQ